MFKVKICGITSADDARAAAQAGADALGLNFYAGSPRFLEFALASEISAAVPNGVAKVGLFVDADADTIRHELALDLIQLHGDESPELLASLAP